MNLVGRERGFEEVGIVQQTFDYATERERERERERRVCEKVQLVNNQTSSALGTRQEPLIFAPKKYLCDI